MHIRKNLHLFVNSLSVRIYEVLHLLSLSRAEEFPSLHAIFSFI